MCVWNMMVCSISKTCLRCPRILIECLPITPFSNYWIEIQFSVHVFVSVPRKSKAIPDRCLHFRTSWEGAEGMPARDITIPNSWVSIKEVPISQEPGREVLGRLSHLAANAEANGSQCKGGGTRLPTRLVGTRLIIVRGTNISWTVLLCVNVMSSIFYTMFWAGRGLVTLCLLSQTKIAYSLHKARV